MTNSGMSARKARPTPARRPQRQRLGSDWTRRSPQPHQVSRMSGDLPRQQPDRDRQRRHQRRLDVGSSRAAEEHDGHRASNADGHGKQPQITHRRRQNRPGGPAGARHVGGGRLGRGRCRSMGLSACGSPVRRRIPVARSAVGAYSMPTSGASCPICPRHSGRGMLTGRLCTRVLDAPAHAADETGFFSGASASIFTVPDSSGYGDKRGRNKPIGPGGSTRRLHHMPVRALNASFGARASDGGELGSTKV